jgi:uncharacterized protein (DUF1778 family)
MNKTERFTFRLSPEERKLVEALAAHLKRNRSDTLRTLLLRSANELGLGEEVQR